MLLYANGDSFTAGTELADNMLPGWPGYRDDCLPDSPKMQEYLQWFKRVIRKEKHAELWALAEDTSRKLAWPQQLANRLGLQCYNNAQGGSSFDRICRTTVSDLLQLKKEHTEIVAVISITDIFRSEIPDARHPDLWEPFDPKTTPESNSPNYHVYLNLAKFKILHETVFYRLWSFYWNALQVKNFCAINNIKLFWVEVFPDGFYPHVEEREHPVLKPLIDEVDLQFITSLSDIASMSTQEQKYCPGGHFRKEIHVEIAQKIRSKIIRQLKL